MIHVQHMEVGPDVDTVAHARFASMAEAKAATEVRPYGPGHWQELSDTVTGERLVRAGGRPEWQRTRPSSAPST